MQINIKKCKIKKKSGTKMVKSELSTLNSIILYKKANDLKTKARKTEIKLKEKLTKNYKWIRKKWKNKVYIVCFII